MSLLSSRFKAASTAILHKWDPPEAFAYGDIVMDKARPWWGRMMYVRAAVNGPDRVEGALCAFLDEGAELPPGVCFPVGRIFFVRKGNLLHAPE